MRESHSLSFTDSQGNTKNTFTDYHLIAKGKPSIDPPEVQTEYVEILGRNGLLDMTGGVDGEIRFKNMAATWSFIVDPRFDYYNVFHRLMRELHGQKMSIVLNDDDQYATYIGRLTIGSVALGEHFNEIVISANIDPNYTRTQDNPEKKEWEEPPKPVAKFDVSIQSNLVSIKDPQTQSGIYTYLADTYLAYAEMVPEQSDTSSYTWYRLYYPIPRGLLSEEDINNFDRFAYDINTAPAEFNGQSMHVGVRRYAMSNGGGGYEYTGASKLLLGHSSPIEDYDTLMVHSRIHNSYITYNTNTTGRRTAEVYYRNV